MAGETRMLLTIIDQKNRAQGTVVLALPRVNPRPRHHTCIWLDATLQRKEPSTSRRCAEALVSPQLHPEMADASSGPCRRHPHRHPRRARRRTQRQDEPIATRRCARQHDAAGHKHEGHHPLLVYSGNIPRRHYANQAILGVDSDGKGSRRKSSAG